jgi:hypothetical protein
MTLRQRLRVSIVQIAQRKNLFQASWHWLHENGRIDMRPSSGMVWINQALIPGKGRDWALPAVGRRQAHDPWDVSTTRASHQLSAKGRTSVRNDDAERGWCARCQASSAIAAG